MSIPIDSNLLIFNNIGLSQINCLVFNKYGVLVAKKQYNKDDMKKVKYSKKITENNVSQKSFVGKFLSSIKQKMYGKRKF